MSGTIVVGYAGTPASRAALATAAGLADELAAALHVVHVIDLRDFPVDPDSVDWERAGSRRLESERAEVAEQLHAFAGRWDYDLERGNPAHAIAAAALQSQARMIVVGAHVGSRFGGALEHLLRASRSVAHALEHSEHADIPVLIVPTREPHVR
jgi:nucleotide-binding universal stress UspA family protein